MSDIAIRVDGLGKRYRLGLEQQGHFRYRSLRDSLVNVARRPWSLISERRRMTNENSFWALEDVTFEVKRGEAVGVVGRNGAGKSTLLKILSQITKPTTGRAELFGRVGSLLEVGTGFHPELTGRENIYLNGAILGMRRSEIRRRFDQIVAFSAIDKFLDTPVKQYSSGMYTRLAFAVAAHLEPEILVVDEVLAVGDAEFQKKCVGKMKDVASEGRTVLFVSHNMGAVRTICRRGVFLTNGQAKYFDRADAAVDAYLCTLQDNGDRDVGHRTDRRGRGATRFLRATASGKSDPGDTGIATGRPFEIAFAVSNWLPDLHCTLTIYDMQGQPICNYNSSIANPLQRANGSDTAAYDIVWRTDECLLVPGRYRVNAALSSGSTLEDHLEGILDFVVHPGALRGHFVTGSSGYGSMLMPHNWCIKPESAGHAHPD